MTTLRLTGLPAILLCAATAAAAPQDPEVVDAPASDEPAATGPRWIDLDRTDRAMLVRTPQDELPLVDALGGGRIQLGVTTTGRYATQSLTDRTGLVSYRYDVAGAWRLVDEPASRGYVSWWIQGGRPVGAPRESDLSVDIGSTFDLDANRLNADVAVRELYWAQIFGDAVLVTAGRIDTTYRYDFNAIANNEWDDFVAAPLVNSSAVPFPNSGLGADLRWQIDEQFAVRGGVYQTNSSETITGLDRLRSDELFWVLETTVTPELPGLGDGAYRFLLFYTESDGESGAGFSMSLDQDLGGGVTPFLRFGVSDDDITDFEYFFSAGVGFDGPFGRPDDRFSVGYAWGDPTADDTRDEHVVEAYYRVALGHHVTVTPDLQLVLDPGLNPEDDVIAVFGVRLQVTF